MTTTRTETVAAADGGTFAATLVLPERGSGPGILLLQEIFGVNDFILAKANDLAERGYAVLCPDVFWRVQPGVALPHDMDALQQAFGYVQRYSSEVSDTDKVADLGAALAHLRSLPEVTGAVATMGYCLGGTLAYRAASHHDADACVSYYGSGVADALAAGETPGCPTIFHFGGNDPYIPTEQVDAISAAFAGRDGVEVHVHPDAGHAFENHLAPQFSDPDAAARSWPLTLDFLERHLRP